MVSNKFWKFNLLVPPKRAMSIQIVMRKIKLDSSQKSASFTWHELSFQSKNWKITSEFDLNWIEDFQHKQQNFPKPYFLLFLSLESKTRQFQISIRPAQLATNSYTMAPKSEIKTKELPKQQREEPTLKRDKRMTKKKKHVCHKTKLGAWPAGNVSGKWKQTIDRRRKKRLEYKSWGVQVL